MFRLSSCYLLPVLLIAYSNYISGQHIEKTKAYTKEIKKLVVKRDSLIKRGDYEQAYHLGVDSLNTLLKLNKIADQFYTTFEGDTIYLSQLNKPFVIHNASKYCRACICEISAINATAKEYEKDLVTFVMMGKEEPESFVAKYEKPIVVVKKVSKIKSNLMVDAAKELTMPNSFYINDEKRIYAVTQGATCPNDSRSKKESDRINHENITSRIKMILNY